MNMIQKLKTLKKLPFILVGSGSAILFIYYLFKQRKNNKSLVIQSESENQQLNNRLLYDQPLCDICQFTFANHPIQYNPLLYNISYHIILNLNKGNIYQGINIINFSLTQPIKQHKFYLNYNGMAVKYVNVNGKLLDRDQVQYHNHRIAVDSRYFKMHNNRIEIVFQSKYSFLNQGISAYFILDEHNKYSLKEQVIYTKNGPYQVQKMIPCLNVLNQCMVKLILRVLKQPKMLRPSMYDFIIPTILVPIYITIRWPKQIIQPEPKLHINLIRYINLAIIFFNKTLKSIHGLFLFSSNICQLKYQSIHIKMLVRYFCKAKMVDGLLQYINVIHRHLVDVFDRLEVAKLLKIQFFFVNDQNMHGQYSDGVIMLKQNMFQHQHTLHIRDLYIIARAVVGMIRNQTYNPNSNSKKSTSQSPLNHLSINQILQINQTVYIKFPQCRSYIYLKQREYIKIKQLMLNKNVIDEYQLRFIQYYNREVKYLVDQKFIQNHGESIALGLRDLITKLQHSQTQNYWRCFITQYAFFSSHVAELLLKISINEKGIPFSSPQLISSLKQIFTKSKYKLHFYSNQQLEQNLPYLMSQKSALLQQRLPYLRIKQRYRQYIKQQYQNYLPIKSNKQQAKSIYQQFKRFKEVRNFHHVMVLSQEIQRVNMFGKDFVTNQIINLECGFMAWKLLSNVYISPQNQHFKKVVQALQIKKAIIPTSQKYIEPRKTNINDSLNK